MGTVTRTITVVAALFWLSVVPSFGQMAAPSPAPCSRKNCAGNAALSGFSGGALAACTKRVIAACTAGTCTCGPSGTCNGATLCASTTTTSTTATTTTSSTTSTTVPLSLKYTTTVGTTSCGGAGLTPGATAPFSGQLDSDTACTTKITNGDLGLSCLYIGGGSANTVPPGATPAGATSYLDVGPGGTLVASNGTGSRDCTKGSSTTASHCVNADAPQPSCTSDANCGGTAGACQPVENCFFGPPLAIQSPAVPSNANCVINVVKFDASGTGDPTTGAATVNIPLVSRIYLTGNEASPCPRCNCGTPPCSGTGAPPPCAGFCADGTTPCLSNVDCAAPPCNLRCGDGRSTTPCTSDADCTGTGCTAGPNVGGACSTTATTGNPATSNTSQDCPPEEGMGLFVGALPVGLNPLTTSSVSVTSATGFFCAGQTHAGAFGKAVTRCITETGAPAGNLTDGAPHAATEATVFCIPATSNGTLNILADLPGPGATSLPGLAQIVPTP